MIIVFMLPSRRSEMKDVDADLSSFSRRFISDASLVQASPGGLRVDKN